MSESQEGSEANAGRFPLTNIFLKGVIAPGVYYKDILRLAWPFLVIFVAATVVTVLIGDEAPAILGLIGFVVVIMIFVAFLSAIIGFHRIFILGPDSVKERRWIEFGSSEWRYLGWSVLIGFLSTLVVVPLAALIVGAFSAMAGAEVEGFTNIALLTLGVQIPAGYFMARWSLLLPAAATEYLPALSLGWAWQLSRPCHWQLFLLIGVLPIATGFVTGLLNELLGPVAQILAAPLWLYVAVAELAMLSLSFEWLTRGEKAAAAAALPPEQPDEQRYDGAEDDQRG